ncbi:MFS transporter [Candidatus Poribacteria bacterium]|nr:MFS transporter [Candidatus Poribacteria bacterium]
MHSSFLILCAAGGFAIFSSTMSKTPVLPLFADSLGAAPQTVGLIAAAATVVGILTSAPVGLLSDYIGRKKIILAAGFVFASAPFLYYLVRTPGQLAALRLYHGFATAIFGPVALAFVADMFSAHRAEKMGWFSSATLIGRFIAPLLGGFLIVKFDFKTTYLFCGIFGIIALALLIFLPGTASGSVFGFFFNPKSKTCPERSRRIQNPKSNGSGKRFDLNGLMKEFKDLFTNGPLIVTSACDAALYFAFGAVETFFPLYAIKNGMNAGEVGVLFSAQILTIAFSKPLMGRMSDRYGRKGAIIIGLTLGAVAVACVALVEQFVIIALVLIAFGFAMSIVTASTAALAADLSRKGTHGSSMGLLSSIMDVGHASGPVVAGIIVAASGYKTSFAVAAAVMLAAILPFSFLVHKESAEPS